VIHLDTSFIVDLMREQRADRVGPASTWLDGLPEDEVLALSVHVVCELMAGAGVAGRAKGEVDRLSYLTDALLIRYPDQAFAVRYGRLLADIRSVGKSIDTMDLLIATAALLDDAPLVTGNVRHFSKVPGLRVVGY
jgi:predicted nucleic acid-binding protein